MNEEKRETYQMDMKCDNCGQEFIRDFEKGTICNGFYICPNCGCREACSFLKN